MAPVLRAGIPTTPYRVGIDQVGYAETAQYLLEGGTLTNLRARLLAELNTTDLTKAKLQNLRALHFETYVDSEFLLKATRWGFPGAVAALTFLTRSVHVYKIEFILVILSYALALALAFRILRDYFLLPTGIAFAIMTALALNCNLLNVYYEGQLTQIFMLPYFILVLLLYLQARTLRRESPRVAWGASRLGRSVALFALVVACMFAAYNETLVLLIGFVFVTFALDLVLYRRIDALSLGYAGLGLVGGFVAAFPFSNQWLVYTFANLRGLATAGFWQPYWASFADILGFFDMYHVPGYVLRVRPIANGESSIALSVALVAIFLYFLWRFREIDASFWITPTAIVLAAYLKMRFVDRILNYPYMKIYTMLVPLMVCVVFAALYLLAEDKRALSGLRKTLRANARLMARVALYTALVAVSVTGVLYIRQYVVQEGYVTPDMFSMYKYVNGRREFDEFALVVPRPAPDIGDFMLVPLISMNLVNENDGEKYIAPYLKSPVVVLFRPSDITDRGRFLRTLHGTVAYSNASYILVDTGSKLKDICTKAADRYTLNALDINNKGDWPGLPTPQCDYRVGIRYLTQGS